MKAGDIVSVRRGAIFGGTSKLLRGNQRDVAVLWIEPPACGHSVRMRPVSFLKNSGQSAVATSTQLNGMNTIETDRRERRIDSLLS